ncbi:choline ABC transporter ATP-binding protein [Paracoccus bogoriensis]|uniref:choline ABC transporter ATP-binding protein n=1 Tax=Paracoccus bogoriensis TaxID=242065 RepID=UPI001CA4FEA1|nr:choline ABC transporter ATP-binding protein [Paracoccus bogoriensis]MBW7055765.1 choline ABC transporter ATP-binding protein [Paracoccus bogoriensis]
MSRIAVAFDRVNIVFGDHPERALPLMDEGLERGLIKAETGQVLGVHDCSLDVAEGEILVLMGLSGSGKSTLLRAVNALNPVCRGEVRLRVGDEMVSVTAARGRALREIRLRQVAMVFQQFGLLPWRTVRENVGLGLELAGVPAAERRAVVDRHLAVVNLSDWADRKVGDLSGGMQQRVGLARAFATEAPILLMDEPFSALDPLIRARLQDELLELQARTKRTIIFVSHDLDEAFKLGNRIALMEGGRIVQVGTARQIIAAPANGYVADFVAHMNPLGVLTAEDVAQEGTLADARSLPRNLPLREVMRHLAETPALALEGGGVVRREAVLARLAERG